MGLTLPVQHLLRYKRSGAATVVYSGWDATGKDSEITLSGTNSSIATFADVGSSQGGSVRGTASHSSGKWYFELTAGAFTASDVGVGIVTSTETLTESRVGAGTGGYGFTAANSLGWQGLIYNNNSPIGGQTVAGQPWVATNVIGVSLDLTGNLIYFRVNGTNYNSQNPTAGTGGVSVSAGTYFPAYGQGSGSDSIMTINTGGSAFQTAAPTGYTAWG